AVRRVEDRQPAVRDLGALRDALRSDGCQIDRDLPAVHDALERLAEARGVRAAVGDLVVRALVLEGLFPRPDGAQDLDVLPCAAQLLPVRPPVPSLDDLRPVKAPT